MDISLLEQLFKGDVEAYQRVIDCLSNGVNFENQPASSRWLEDLVFALEAGARKGRTAAMVLLGNAYYNGWFVTKNNHTALDYARRAASLNDAGGEVLLGFMYANGYAVVKDYKRALFWFKRALEKNNSMAINNMGVIYEQGLGVKKDLNMAIKYYKEAALQKNSLAIANLERLQGVKSS